MRGPRLSYQSVRVMWLLWHMRDEISGADMTRMLKISSGTMYPILVTFKNAGWVSSKREKGDAHKLRRPVRTFYKLTKKGLKKAHAVLSPLQFIHGSM